MPGELPEDGVRDIWLNQPTEIRTMTLRIVQQRSRELRAKTRRKMLGTFAGPLAVLVFYAVSQKEFATLQWALRPLFAVALMWSLAGLFFLNQGLSSAAPPGDAGLGNGLQFCRREMERQRDLVRRGLVWSFGPVLLSIGIFVLALAMVATQDRGVLPNGLPFLSLVVLWIVAYFFLRVREQRALQREIGELENVDREA